MGNRSKSRNVPPTHVPVTPDGRTLSQLVDQFMVLAGQHAQDGVWPGFKLIDVKRALGISIRDKLLIHQTMAVAIRRRLITATQSGNTWMAVCLAGYEPSRPPLDQSDTSRASNEPPLALPTRRPGRPVRRFRYGSRLDILRLVERAGGTLTDPEQILKLVLWEWRTPWQEGLFMADCVLATLQRRQLLDQAWDHTDPKQRWPVRLRLTAAGRQAIGATIPSTARGAA